jgi:hypothetical protein
MAGLIAIAVVVPVILGALSGAITIPHNDDFNYRRVALGLYEDGRIELARFSVMSLIGQVLAVQPFLWLTGGSPWAFALAGIGFTLLAIVAGYLLVRRVLSPGRAAVAMLTFVLFPGFLLNATSFMTDVPELATAVACLALGAAAIGRDGTTRWRWFAASLAMGCFAFSIREVALAAPIAVLIAVAMADRGPRRPFAYAGASVVAACLGIHVFTASLPDQGSVGLDFPAGLQRLRIAYSTVALVLLPAMVLAISWWRRRWRRRDVVAGLLIGYLLTWTALTTLIRTGNVPEMLIGNLFSIIGASGGGGLAGSRPIIYPDAAWKAVEDLALVGAILLPAIALGIVGSVIHSGGLSRARTRRWLGSTTGIILLFSVFTATGLAAYGYAITMFDRYLWSLAFTLAALLLYRPPTIPESEAESESGVETEPATEAVPGVDGEVEDDAEARTPAPEMTRPTGGRKTSRPAIALTGALLSLMGVLSILQLLNSNAFTAARWKAGDEAVALGIPAGTIDAGMEWVGYNSTGVAVVGRRASGLNMWYTGWWPSFHQCAVVSSTPLRRARHVLVTAEPGAYRQYQLFGPELPLYLYRITDPLCP